ncbi:hypothetical protein D3C72_854510 [compost metagenome]
MIFLPARFERSPQVAARIAPRAACRNRISENLTARLKLALRHLDRTAGLDCAHHVQQLGRFDLGDGHVTDHRQHVVFQAAPDTGRIGRHPLRLDVREPFLGDGLERRGLFDLGPQLVRLLFLTWVSSGRQDLLRLVALRTRIRQRHGRILAERKLLLLAVEAVGHVPEPRAAGGHQHVQAAAIGELVGLVAGLGVADRGIGKGHLLAFRCWLSFEANNKANIFARCARPLVDDAGPETLGIAGFSGPSWTVMDDLGRRIGGPGGNHNRRDIATIPGS